MDYAKELINKAFTSESTETEAFKWIAKNISSCQNKFHLEGCSRLIELFNERFGKRWLSDELWGLYYQKLAMIIIPV